MSSNVAVRSLYRQFLRHGKALADASPNHAVFVLKRAAYEFRRPLAELDEESDFCTIEERIAYGHTLLEQLQAQSVYPGFGELRTMDERSGKKSSGSDKNEDNFW